MRLSLIRGVRRAPNGSGLVRAKERPPRQRGPFDALASRELLLRRVESLPVGLTDELRQVRSLVLGAQGVTDVRLPVLPLTLVLGLLDLGLVDLHLLALLDVIELDCHWCP